MISEPKNTPLSYDLSYAGLPKAFYKIIAPSPVAAPSLVQFNEKLAQSLGLSKSWGKQNLDYLTGNYIPKELSPIAMAYSGHQFGGWSPLLGDGRAILVGEVKAPSGDVFELQLKGSGQTPYSRHGDGRATLGSVMREYIISEAMAGLGIPTTRSLGVITTGETVQRERGFHGAVLPRISKSHIRIGTFQLAVTAQDETAVQALADYCIDKNFANISTNDSSKKYEAFLQAVVSRQANLIAKWMCVGFIHGVMNTDNMSIVGETIDYGPCAFMDIFHPEKVFSSIDHQGRYAWGKQPTIAAWNLSRFAECLLPLLNDNADKSIVIAQEALKLFTTVFKNTFYNGMAKKFGIQYVNEAGPAQDNATVFIDKSLNMLANEALDFTLFFRRLSQLAQGAKEAKFLSLFPEQKFGEVWLEKWRAQSPNEEIMRNINPIFIARNHRVEEAIRAAEDHGDYTLFRHLISALQNPFVENIRNADLEAPPEPHEIVQQTFCGT